VQESKGEFTVKVVPRSQFSDKIRLKIIDQLKTFTGENHKIDIEVVEKIPLLKTGKRTPVISSVAIDFQDIEESKIWRNKNNSIA
jgi:hypothetical protein